ncbi:MAG TPA: IS110 family transposase [Polyangiales bacterium]
MKLYAGIDLHSNNSMLVILDEQDRVHLQERLPNERERILLRLAQYKRQITGVVVESTYNWYWLVDALVDAGYKVHLAHPAALVQYQGLKHSADEHDARWLAHLLRLGILHEGYIYPRQARAVRDLMRRRMQLVQTRSAQIVCVQTQLARSTASSLSGEAIKRMQAEQLEQLLEDANVGSAVRANLEVIATLSAQISRLEGEILQQVKLAAQFAPLLSISGVGRILALTIMLESGAMERFAKVGNFSSYARCVDSKRLSNDKKKGEGNRKSGNKYLAWAFVEAAHFAVRYSPRIKRFYERKAAKTNKVVAIKAVAHKLARAAYHVMREQVPFDEARAFA